MPVSYSNFYSAAHKRFGTLIVPNRPALPRATLLGRMEHGDDQASWREFFDIYWQLIYRFARKAGLNDW